MEERKVQAEGPAGDRDRLSVLVADDDVFNREAINKMMQANYPNFSLLMAQNGQHALDLMNEQAQPPDLAIVDLQMPIMNGVDACTQIRRRHPGTYVVLCSANIPNNLEALYQSTGCNRFVLKPLMTDTLHQIVRDIAQL
jgi:CheY-like chemotaxis protein